MHSVGGQPAEPSSESTTPSRGKYRPMDSAFRQQRMRAFMPVFTLKVASPIFLWLGLILVTVGVGLVVVNEQAVEVGVDYTHCKQFFWENGTTGDVECWRVISNITRNCSCVLNLTLTEDIPGEVTLYYELSNYYQNRRRYIESRDDNQLRGRLSQHVSPHCSPYDYDSQGIAIVPCGVVADSLFNDSIKLRHWRNGELSDVPLLRTGIAWTTDKQRLFGNPPGADLAEAFRGFAKPHSWRKHVYELDPEDPTNNGLLNEDLIVWMRVAALPSFRKKYRRVNHAAKAYLRSGLPAGSYVAAIDYAYPVTQFHGSKRLLVTNGSILGGRCAFLSLGFVAVGFLSLVLATLTFVLYKFNAFLAPVVVELRAGDPRER